MPSEASLETTALRHLETALDAARKAGADAADAVFSGGESTSVSVRLGAVEDIDRSESAELGLRVFAENRAASITLSDFTNASIAAAAARAVAMARAATPDDHAGLADPARLAKDIAADLDLIDDGDVTPADLETRARACEDAARAVDGITNSGGGGASAGRATFAFATSTGFAAARSGTSHSVYAAVIAGTGDGMQRDYAQSGARHLADVEDVEAVGTRAGTRTVARLDPVRPRSGAIPVLFDRRVSASLLGHFTSAINGMAVARGTTFLDDPAANLFTDTVTITDDPHRVRGRRSRTFDGEGLPTARRDLVARGRLTGWLMHAAAARQLDGTPTGHAVRGTSGPPGIGTSNLHMAAGTIGRDDMIADVDMGVLITSLIGQGVSIVTGDYSRGASGFLIENGRITRPVDGITIAGNLADMFAHLTPADDLVFDRATVAPTVRVDGMTVAGD
ncbi:MAG: metallopeptidase TldD-related protein [Pseudomonadota bacterium]